MTQLTKQDIESIIYKEEQPKEDTELKLKEDSK
jgi:hypothetical protein